MRFLFLVFFSVLIVACSKEDDTAANQAVGCFPGLAIGLKIDVRNSETNKFVDSGIIVKARDGAYEQVLRLSTSPQPMADTSYTGNSRLGTYRITIRGDEYELFTSDPVEVMEYVDRCNNITVSTTSKTYMITPKN